jgi:hypothetical protein
MLRPSGERKPRSHQFERGVLCLATGNTPGAPWKGYLRAPAFPFPNALGLPEAIHVSTSAFAM